MDTDPETWRWIWLGATFVLVAGELAVPGTFFLLPFGISAALAMVLAFLGVPVGFQWAVFVVVGVALFAVFWRMGREFLRAKTNPIGVGAERLLHQHGQVIETIPGDPGQAGMVKIGAEHWRAVSQGEQTIPEGTAVKVVAMKGTRVVVTPVQQREGSH